jgi:hypothetical protein
MAPRRKRTLESQIIHCIKVGTCFWLAHPFELTVSGNRVESLRITQSKCKLMLSRLCTVIATLYFLFTLGRLFQLPFKEGITLEIIIHANLVMFLAVVPASHLGFVFIGSCEQELLQLVNQLYSPCLYNQEAGNF